MLTTFLQTFPQLHCDNVTLLCAQCKNSVPRRNVDAAASDENVRSASRNSTWGSTLAAKHAACGQYPDTIYATYGVRALLAINHPIDEPGHQLILRAVRIGCNQSSLEQFEATTTTMETHNHNGNWSARHQLLVWLHLLVVSLSGIERAMVCPGSRRILDNSKQQRLSLEWKKTTLPVDRAGSLASSNSRNAPSRV